MKEYFSHDFGARNDPKLIDVMLTLGHEGKSVYWDLVEMLYEQNGYLMLLQCKSYAFALRTDCALLTKLVNDFGLFANDGERFWSETALRRLEQRNLKSAKAKESASKRWATSERNANALPTQCEGNASKGKEIKGKEIKGNDKPPMSDDLKARLAGLTDTSGEVRWNESLLTKPDYFAKVVGKLEPEPIDCEHYRRMALLAAEADDTHRTLKGWQSWVGKFLTNQGRPLLKPQGLIYNETPSNAQAGAIRGSTIPSRAEMMKPQFLLPDS